jgi:hypothetical protein
LLKPAKGTILPQTRLESGECRFTIDAALELMAEAGTGKH